MKKWKAKWFHDGTLLILLLCLEFIMDSFNKHQDVGFLPSDAINVQNKIQLVIFFLRGTNTALEE